MDREAERIAATQRMIRDQIAARGVRDPRVLQAIREVPRDLFVPQNLLYEAFEDTPLPIEAGQTISQPYIVALMTEVLALRGDEKVLEIGTGTGYQTAILAKLAREVFSAELEAELSSGARARLERLGIANVTLRIGDGTQVFREQAPFDAILAAAAAEEMPTALFDQLAEGGRCVLPVGDDDQYLWLVKRVRGEIVKQQLAAVRFVPLRERAREPQV